MERSRTVSDRALQDDLIRYLTDASQRARAPIGLPISGHAAARADRFAHFLARHYYRDRLARSFQYSGRFSKQTGRAAEQVVDDKEFGSFLSSCVMGSFHSARCVAEMAMAYLAAPEAPVAWWIELLEYEQAYFLQAATSETAPSPAFPACGLSTVCKNFSWDLPAILADMRESDAKLPGIQRALTLLFSRGPLDRVYVVELEDPVAGVFQAVNGYRTVEEISSAARVPFEQTQRDLEALHNIGAVVGLSVTNQ